MSGWMVSEWGGDSSELASALLNLYVSLKFGDGKFHYNKNQHSSSLPSPGI